MAVSRTTIASVEVYVRQGTSDPELLGIAEEIVLTIERDELCVGLPRTLIAQFNQRTRLNISNVVTGEEYANQKIRRLEQSNKDLATALRKSEEELALYKKSTVQKRLFKQPRRTLCLAESS